MQDEMVFFVRPNDVVSDTIEGETVVIDLLSGVYFRFDGAASHAWNALLGRATEAAVVDQVAAAYAAPRDVIAAEVHAFLLTLYRDGVIRREGGSGGVSGADTPGMEAPGLEAPGLEAPREAFTGLPVERFDQLQPLVGGTPSGLLPFDGMTVSRFEDLEELLTIDPVHEVEDTGWPHRQAAD